MPNTAVLVHDCGDPLAATNLFRVGMAQTLEDVIACQRLRYLVFNCELGEGFDGSDRTGLDRDRFDFICDHLMVRDSATGKLAGTYRMQSGYRARGNLGYYGEEFFDFGPFEEIRCEVLELGRACVHREYRNTNVLHMLWKGIARYALRLSGYLGAHLRTSSNRPGIQNYRFPDVGGLASAAGSRANAVFLNTCMASEHRSAICSGGSSANG